MLRRTFALWMAGQACTGTPVLAQPLGGDPVLAAAGRFLALAQCVRQLAAAERPGAVNRHINQRVDYTADLDLCGRRDCWQTPAETLASGRGDCEDYAIAKYFLLAACAAGGCPRLVFARFTPVPSAHDRLSHVAVIADAHDGDPVVLDCLDPPLQPLSQRPDLHPIFSFDDSGLWRGTAGERVGEAALRLRPWRAVLERWALQQRAAALVP